MPEIDALATEYGDRGLVVLGLNLWEPQGKVKQYQNMYPNILMLKDDGQVWNVYKKQGYIPLNYLIGHDFKQTVDYSEEGYDHAIILDHILNLLSDVSIKISSDSPSYQVGTNLGITIEFTNHTGSSTGFYALVEVALPSGSTYYPLLPWTFFALDPYGVGTLPINFRVPLNVPLGTYNLRVMIGFTDLWYLESLDFDIVP